MATTLMMTMMMIKMIITIIIIIVIIKVRGADKSLARPGRKQARKHVREEHDFKNIKTRAVMKYFFLPQGKVPKKIHAILTETLACYLPGQTKDLSALSTYNLPRRSRE